MSFPRSGTTRGSHTCRALPFLLLLAWSSTVTAGGGGDNWIQRNARASLDLSVRVIDGVDRTWTQQAYGLDVHKVFSSSRGDIGTLVFQPYLVRIDNAPNVPPIFDDEHDQALQWRIANFNYTGFGHGRFNIRIGHFELPFGLEQVVQTNGTLYQMNAATNGPKADWGVSVNGHLPWLEYEVAHMRGGGNEISTKANGLHVARAGLPRDNRWWVGVSGLNGEIETRDRVTEKRRTGIDLGIRMSAGVTLMTEISRGTEAGEDIRHWFAEAGWASIRENTFVYLQWRDTEFPDRVSDERVRRASLGTRYEPTRRWSASVEVRRDFDADRNWTALAQFRYRWQT